MGNNNFHRGRINLIIETERLLIRPPTQSDIQPLNEAIKRSLPELKKWMPWAADQSFKTTELFINKSIQYWHDKKPKELPMIVELKSNSEIVGVSGFNEKSNFDIPMFEIGYWADTKHVGNGYVTEAVIAITKLAFEQFSAIRVQICMQKGNEKSIAVANRAGFIKDAILKNYRLDCLSKKPCDEIIYACFDSHQIYQMKY